MGGTNSGRRRKVAITDPVKNMIKVARSFGIKWSDIAAGLGYKDTDYLEVYRRDNPEFAAECETAFMTRKLNFAQKLEKAALPNDGPANTILAIKFAEQFGIFEKETKAATTAVQINGGNNSAGIQVCFVEANPKQLPQSDIIDVSQN